MDFLTKYIEGYKTVIRGFDDPGMPRILRVMGKFLTTLKLLFDMLPLIVIIIGGIAYLFGWRP
ncbi:MAG: hypothetical protein CMA68_02590 [Euryarchaeota archaeon]|nr:hypothetical protein [Euryarchaeota archaeon]